MNLNNIKIVTIKNKRKYLNKKINNIYYFFYNSNKLFHFWVKHESKFYSLYYKLSFLSWSLSIGENIWEKFFFSHFVIQNLFIIFRITIEASSKDTTLLVKNVERGDSGKYTLSLSNTSGSISSWGDVIVLGKNKIFRVLI